MGQAVNWIVRTNTRKATAAFYIFVTLGILWAWPSLAYPMVYDDLHLIRSFSNEQILSSFHGNWDPDGIETPGLRPLTLLFNYGRYILFGENVMLHRVFLIILFAIFLTMMCWIAYMLGLPWKVTVAAGALCIMAKYSIYHYVWIADGVHLFQGGLIGLSIIALLLGIRRTNILLLILALITILMSVLTREDTLAVVPVSILMGYFYARTFRRQPHLRLMHIYTGFLLGLMLILLIYRRFTVPEAQAVDFHPDGLLSNFVLSLSPFGLKYFDALSLAFIAGWIIILTVTVLVRAIQKQSIIPASSRLWLLCTIMASSSGLTLARVNLLLVSTYFGMLFVCSLLWETVKNSRRQQYLSLGLMLCTFMGSYYISTNTAQIFHPRSLWAISWNSELVYGKLAAQATIPDERRQVVVAQLATFGLSSALDMEQQLPEMIALALQNNEQQCDCSSQYFFPRVLAFQP